MSTVRFSEQERAFIVTVASYCRDVDVALTLGRSTQSVKSYRYQHCVAGRDRHTQPLARRAVKRAHERFLAGESLRLGNLMLWVQWRGRKRGRQLGNRNEAWTAGDVSELLERAGYEPLDAIAVDLRRSWLGVYAKLRELGLAHLAFGFSCARLARRLGVARRTVNGWCHIMLEGQPLLRSWREVHPRVVHRDDALWLLEGGYTRRRTDWLDLRREFWNSDEEETT